MENDNNKNKDGTSKEKPIGCLMIVLCLIAGTFGKVIGHRSHSHIRSSYSISDTEFNKITDNAMSKVNEQFNEFDSAEELIDKYKDNFKNDDNSAISAFNGFILSAQSIKEYCEPTGYIPEKYINEINSYKRNVNLEEDLIKNYTKMGANRKQALIIIEKVRNTLNHQFIRFIDNDYNELKKSDSSYTKKDYCKLYDLNMEEIISYKINEIKKAVPSAYNKYFEKKSL